MDLTAQEARVGGILVELCALLGEARDDDCGDGAIHGAIRYCRLHTFNH